MFKQQIITFKNEFTIPFFVIRGLISSWSKNSSIVLNGGLTET